jgi:uncharacterized small protein (TIGR04563 family)
VHEGTIKQRRDPDMASTDKRKQSLYFADDTLGEIMAEAIRLDRSLSWVIQCAWRLASREVRRFPPADHPATASGPGPRAPDGWLAPAPEKQSCSLPEPQPDPQVREFLRGKFEYAQTMTQG